MPTEFIILCTDRRGGGLSPPRVGGECLSRGLEVQGVVVAFEKGDTFALGKRLVAKGSFSGEVLILK